MKKTITTLLAVLLVAIMAFAVVACDKDENDGVTEAPTSTSTEAPTQAHSETSTEAPTENNQQGVTNDESKHTHSYTEKIVSEAYLKSEANCSSQAQYFYSCECGEKGSSTFGNGPLNNEIHVGGTSVGYEYISDSVHEVVEYCNGCLISSNIIEQTHSSSCSLCAENVPAGLYNTVIYVDEEDETKTKEYLFILRVATWDKLVNKGAFDITDGVLSVTETGKDILDGNLVMEEGVHTFDEWAFSGCVKLTAIVIPNSVTEIKQKAFTGCFNIKDMFMGTGIRTIGHDIFSTTDEVYKGSLENVYIEDLAAWCTISFNGMDSNPLQFAQNLYVNGELVTELVIPEGVTSISDRAFKGCAGVTGVVIPSSVRTIGNSAFFGCDNLTQINIAIGVKTIGHYAFGNYDTETVVAVVFDGTTGEWARVSCDDEWLHSKNTYTITCADSTITVE